MRRVDRCGLLFAPTQQLLPALLGAEPTRVDLFQPALDRETVGADPRQHHMRALVHYCTRKINRVTRARHAGDRAGLLRFAVHDRGVEFILALGGKHRAAPGVEQRIIFEHADRGGNRIERRAALVEQRTARAERLIQPGAIGFLLFGRQRPALDHSGAAMDCERPARYFDDLAGARRIIAHEDGCIDPTGRQVEHRSGADPGDLHTRRVKRSARRQSTQTGAIDNPGIAVGCRCIDTRRAVRLNRKRRALVDAEPEHRGLVGGAIDLRLGDESKEAPEPFAFLKMRVGDDALEQGEVQKVALDRVSGAERVSKRFGAAEAAVIHRTVQLLALNRETGTRSGERLARCDVRIQDIAHGGAPPIADITRLIAAGDKDAVGLAQPVKNLLVCRLRPAVKDEDFGRLDAAYVFEKFLADFLAIGRADHDDMAVSGFAEKPFHRIDIAVAAAHQQQSSRHRTRRRRVQLAEHIMFGGLHFRLFRRHRRERQAKPREQQPKSSHHQTQHSSSFWRPVKGATLHNDGAKRQYDFPFHHSD